MFLSQLPVSQHVATYSSLVVLDKQNRTQGSHIGQKSVSQVPDLGDSVKRLFFLKKNTLFMALYIRVVDGKHLSYLKNFAF